MSTATVPLPATETATSPEEKYEKDYLNSSHGVKSWLLTGDHKRIAVLYLIGVTFFFIMGGLLALIIRLELLTPGSDMMTPDTYNKVFSMHTLCDGWIGDHGLPGRTALLVAEDHGADVSVCGLLFPV